MKNKPTNATRATNASFALQTYVSLRGGDNPVEDAQNLMSDLLHYIKAEGGNPARALEGARMNYEAELVDEEAPPARDLLWSVVVDNGNVDERSQFATREDATKAWRVACERVGKGEAFAAAVRDPNDRQVFYAEAEAD